MGNLILLLIAFVMLSGISTPAYSSDTQSQKQHKACDVLKKNGLPDARPDDLHELAQDWLFFRREIMENPRNDGARRNFEKVNRWLEAYPDAAVADCINSYEPR